MLSKIGAVRQLEMQRELINQTESTEFYCPVLFLSTIIGSEKGICHIILDLFLLYSLSLPSPAFVKKKVCQVELVENKEKKCLSR